MSGSIELHKEHGVNPFLTYCPRCYGEAQELILVGANDGVYLCDCMTSEGGPHKILGKPADRRCPMSKQPARFTLERRLEQGEKLPASQPCDKCKEEIKLHEKVVAAGGIYWRCKECKAKGVMRHTAPMAQYIREQLKTPAPEPCGAEFEKDMCPACGPDAEMHKAAQEQTLKELKGESKEGTSDGPDAKATELPPG